MKREYSGVTLCDRPFLENIRRLDLGALPFLNECHLNGIRIDPVHFDILHDRITEALQEAHEAIYQAVEPSVLNRIGTGKSKSTKPFNPNSGDQVATLLFDELGLELPTGKPRMTKGSETKAPRPAADDEVISKLLALHPVVQPIRKVRELTKLDGTYVTKIPKMVNPSTGRLHTIFRHTRTSTGRIASEDPNLMNIPTKPGLGKEVRNGFIAAPGCVLVSNDLSQIEMVWAAELSQDDNMRGVFLRGDDLHSFTACRAFNLTPWTGPNSLLPTGTSYAITDDQYTESLSRLIQEDLASGDDSVAILSSDIISYKDFKQTKRLPAKTMGFLILYGGGAANLQSQILGAGGDFWEIPACETLIVDFFRVYPGLRVFMDLQEHRVLRYGRVWDGFGRTRVVPGSRSAVSWRREEAIRQAGNMPIQSSAQAVIKLAMAAVMAVVWAYRSMGYVCNPLLQIHDELIFEVSKEIAAEFAAEICNIMETVVKISIPIRASSDVAYRWGDLK